MRLLHCGITGITGITDIIGQPEEFGRDNVPPYAILSHTWGDDEVTFQHVMNGTARERNGYQKLLFCAKQARLHELSYIWVDTCCIDKTNSNELQAAINSMFKWYRDAECCFAYLSDVKQDGALSPPATPSTLPFGVVHPTPFEGSQWFKRGWTLQELLAPKEVEFFSADGEKLGDRTSLEQQIQYATNIPVEALHDYSAKQYSVKQRLQWMSGRKTAQEEDMAYALFGIFGVFMPLIYGEGKDHAEKRLREEISKGITSTIRVSEAVGGVGGKDFDYVAPEGTFVSKIVLWSSGPGRHFQALRIKFSNGMEQSAGRPYGDNNFVEFEFKPGEKIREACLWDNHDGNRLGAISFVTTLHNHVDIGHSRRNETVIHNPELSDFVGFRGKSARDIDRLAFVFRHREEF